MLVFVGVLMVLHVVVVGDKISSVLHWNIAISAFFRVLLMRMGSGGTCDEDEDPTR
jgi:hypothetical protein